MHKIGSAIAWSSVALDEASLLACAAHVDVNRMRVVMARTPEESDFTGAKGRIDDLNGRQAGLSSKATKDWVPDARSHALASRP